MVVVLTMLALVSTFLVVGALFLFFVMVAVVSVVVVLL